MLYNVYGVSNWPEEMGKKFEIFMNWWFDSTDDAIRAAKNAYHDGLEVVVEPCTPYNELPKASQKEWDKFSHEAKHFLNSLGKNSIYKDNGFIARSAITEYIAYINGKQIVRFDK